MKYEITGGNFPVAVCNCDPGEKMLCESGAMSWMTPNMKMTTTTNGGLGKAFGRMFSGESFFMNIYEAVGGPGMIAFASSFPGEIRALEISPAKEVVVQKKAFMASTMDVSLSVFFQKKLGAGFFGGEGFIMQRLSGNGLAFIEVDGAAVEYNLAPGQQLIVNTGFVVMMDITCTMDIQTVPGVKNMLFGGEGLFNTVVTGPGRVLVQTMPVSNIASMLAPYIAMKK